MPPGIDVPGVACWDNLDVWTQAKLIEYDRLRYHDESESHNSSLKSLGAK